MKPKTLLRENGEADATVQSEAMKVSNDHLDDLVQLAALLCATPMALFVCHGVVSGQYQSWIAAQTGFSAEECPQPEILRDLPIYLQNQSIHLSPSPSPQIVQISDLAAHPQFVGQPLIAEEPHLRFYAGASLFDRNGESVGILAVMDTLPRQLCEREMKGLENIGRQISAWLEIQNSISLGGEPEESKKDSQETATVELRYRRLFEAARDGILMLDFKTGQITDANPFMGQLLGCQHSEILGKTLWEIGFAHDEQKSRSAFRKLQERGYIRYENLPLQAQDGEIRDVEFVSNVYEEGGRKVIQCNIRDISERKQSAAIDSEFRGYMQSTLADLASQIIVFDFDNSTPKLEEGPEAGPENGLEDEGELLHNRGSEAKTDRATNENSASGGAQQTGDSPLALAARARGIWSKEAARVVQGIREVMANRHHKLEEEETNLIEQRWFNAFVTYFLDAELMRIVVARQDSAERESADRRIRFQANLLDVVGEAVVATDLEGKVIYWNRFAERLYGWSAQEAQGLDISSLVIPPQDWKNAHAKVAKLIDGDSWSGELRMSNRSGIEFSALVTNTPIYENGQLVGIIGIAKDISERKAATMLLRESEERFRLLVESVQDYAIYLLDTQGRISSWNSGAQRLKGYRADEIIGHHFSCFYLREDIEAGYPEMEIEVATATGRFEGEGIRLRKDGTRFWANVLLTAVRDEVGVLRGFSKVTRDITERKQAEEALERTNREIVTIWESMTDAFIAVDANWTLTHINQHAAIIWKKAPEELLGKNLWELFPSAVWLGFYREYHRAKRDQVPVVFEEFYPPLNGWFEIHAYPSSLGLSIYFRDISQRKAAEQAIRNSEARFQSIVANAPGMVFQFILHPDGSIAIPFVNDGSRRLFSMPPAEIQGKTAFFKEIIHAADYAEWERTIRESARDLSPWDWEGRIKLPDGKVKWVQGAARPKRMPHGGTIWDGLLIEITDRKQAEEERDRFFTLSLDMLCIADHNGYFRRMNPAFERTLGYPLNELQSRSFLELVHPEDYEMTVAELEKLNRGEHTIQFVNRYRCRNGAYRWLSWQAVPYEDLSYAVAHDITPLKEAEAEMRQANDELELRVTRRTEQLARTNEELRIENIERQMTMAALGQVTEAFRQAKEEADAANLAKSEFLSRMSHELRTPLNAILGFGQILEMRPFEPEDSEGISQILKAGWHLLDLVNEILDIARVEAGHLEMSLEPLAIADVVPECCSLLRPLADQREIRIDEDGSPVSGYYVRADRQRLRQILINLLSNAIKYNFVGGVVYVSCHALPNERIRISVRDTGPGLSPQDIEKLFTPFERLNAANSKIEGSGLGLALSQRLLMAMGGQLGVESEAGQGSTFWIDLPRTEAHAFELLEFDESSFGDEGPSDRFTREFEAQDSKAKILENIRRQNPATYSTFAAQQNDASAAPPLPTVSLRILVVEDNPVNQEVIRQQLKNLGHEVMLLDNGFAAIETWQQKPIDLILMDCNMPQMDGYTAAREIRQLETGEHHIPIIALTANAMSGDREKCLAAGMDDYLSKPTKQSTLAEVIARWIPLLGPNNIIMSEPDMMKDSKHADLKRERWIELQEEIDPSLLEELVRLFLQETPAMIEALLVALQQKNASSVAQNAHKIKGSCGTMGAARMEASCREIETLAESGDLAGCLPIIERLPRELSAVQIALQNSLAIQTGPKGL